MTATKLRIRRFRCHWILLQEGVVVDRTMSFRKACQIAAEWYREGWYVAKGWTRR